jgi:hypothetical protein
MAAFLPGDAVTLLLETIPLYILYELSILVASFVAYRDAKRERAEATLAPTGGSGGPAPGGGAGPGGVAAPGPTPSPPSPGMSPSSPVEDGMEPDVKQIIDHIDRELS